MYAAAGGASLASRQARQRQRQNKKTEKLAQLKTQNLKTATAAAAAKAPTQSKQFHNLPANYHQTSAAVKLSRVERNALRPPQTTERRHSTSNHLKEPARARIRESPSMLIPIQNHLVQQHQKGQPLTPTTLVANHLPLSPSMCQLPHGLVPPDLEAGQTHDPERRCSLVRQYEEAEKADKETETHEDKTNHVYCFEVREKGPDGNPLMYTELDRAMFGSMEYPFSECSQGRAAWQERERERRCSLTEAAHNHRVKQTEAHHRWMKRNRIHDTSYGGSSDEEDFFSVYYQSAAANALLYVGLGTTVIGLVIWFVGTGEKGFKTLELRLIGPTLIALGLLCCVIRVLLCICPSTCLRRRKRTRLKPGCPHRDEATAPDPSTALLACTAPKGKKRVSIANPAASTSGHHHHQPLHQHQLHHRDSLLAATSVFLAHEKERNVVPKPIPTIEIPDFAEFNSGGGLRERHDSFIELQNLELSSLEVSSVSSCDSDSITIIEAEVTRAPAKLMRARQPKHGSAETSLGGPPAPPPPPPPAPAHSGIVLSPSKLGQ